MPGLFFYNYQHCNHSSLLRGKTYEGIKNGDLDLLASIHFPLAREDFCTVPCPGRVQASIHFPLAREDACPHDTHTLKPASIHFPLAREDVSRLYSGILQWGFNPLPSCEGRPAVQRPVLQVRHASIHFPLAREDLYQRERRFSIVASIHFPLAREDISHDGNAESVCCASIHFPLAREDCHTERDGFCV